MPHLYVTGNDEHGRSMIAERTELTIERGYFEALRLPENGAVIQEGSDDADLLESPTQPGGAVYNIFTFQPGQGTPMHRTITTDFDVVLQGSVDMKLDLETVTLLPGDCAILPGTAHAWIAGESGAIVMYNLVAGIASGADISRNRERLL